MTATIVVTISALVILLAFEIRHREVVERLALLEEEKARLDREVVKLKEEMKKKKNLYDEYKPPAL